MKKNYLLFLSLFSFIISFSQCDYSLVMNDSYGDGWNGNTIDVLVDGVVVLDDVTLDTGSTETTIFSVTDGQEITTLWNGGGSYGSETSYQILDADGTEVGAGAEASIDTAITVACPPPPSCLYTLVMNDSYGDGWNGNTIDVLVDGVTVLANATIATGTTGSETFEVAVGSIVTTLWNGEGSYGSETSYQILNAAGIEVGIGAQTSIEDDSITGECPSCANPIVTAWNMTLDGVSFEGTNQDGIINYQIEYSETTFTPGDGTATVYEFDLFPHTMTGLTESTTYYFAIRSNCEDSVSDWVGSPDEWTTLATGSTADAPIIIESLPYNTSDDTINYGDDYTNTATGCEGSGSYLGGDDVVYLYTATSDMTLNVSFTPEGTWSGIYVYANAEDVGVNCWIVNSTSSSATASAFELPVVSGSTYYFVISTWPTPQNVAYDLSITELLCGTPVDLAVTNVTSVSADVSWDAGEAVSWEYVSSTVADSTVPTEAGTSITEPSVSIANCYPITGYDVWIRAVCDDGSTSEWTSVTFTTLLQVPECGESISQYDYPNASSGGSTFDDNFDLSNDYSSDLLFTTTAGDQDSDGYTDEVTVTISGSTENNYDWVFITNGAGELLYGPASGAQEIAVTSEDGTINVYLAADTSVQGGPISFDVSCAGLSVNDFDMSDLRIYPNPVNGDYVTIKSPLSGVMNIEVFDITGKRLINTLLDSDTLDVSFINSGIYLVKVTVQGQSKVSKLIVR